MTELELSGKTALSCPACGGRMVFSPSAQALRCPYCGEPRDFRAERQPPYEDDIHFAPPDSDAAWGDLTRVLHCGDCGADLVLTGETALKDCPFCGSEKISEAPPKPGMAPDSLIPFQIGPLEAKKTLEKWLRKKHFAPGKMKKKLLKGDIPGVYWPLWAFSDDVSSEYYGDAGYRVPASEKDDPAKARKIRWEPVTGTVERSYNDIMTPASERMETEDFCDPSSYRMGGLKPYTPEYLAGFCCEKPTLDVRECWRQAQQQVDRRMAAAAQEKVLAEADETAVRRLISTHDNVRFRMVLLPVYMRVYPHGKKRYRVMINGQTGEFSGEAPRSPWRILAVVGIVLLLLMILFYLFVLHGDGKYLLYSA